jgi:hypothetical protein
MSQPSPPPTLPPTLPLHPPPRAPADMTETQNLPLFTQPGFHDYTHRRLPPPIQLKQLEIPPDAVPPRSDFHFRSPGNNHLPSIRPAPHYRHDNPQPQPQPHYKSAAPVDKLLTQPNSHNNTHPHPHPHSHSHSHSQPHPHPHSYSPPHPQHYSPPHSQPPQPPHPSHPVHHYGPPLSPRSDLDRRRYPYEETRHMHHAPHHEQPYIPLASPVEPSHQRPLGPVPSPGYPPSYASSSTAFRGSVGSHSHSQRGSVAGPSGPVTYPDAAPAVPPPRKEARVFPLPGSIPQPVYNEQL